MPRTSINGDDPSHQIPSPQKQRLERSLRERARDLIKHGEVKESKRLNNRARSISRKPSKRAQHHT